MRRACDLRPRTFSPSSPSHCLFSRRPFRCDGGVSDPNARSRRRPTERAGRHLEPRTAKRLLQLHTTHARVHERVIFALASGFPVTSFPAPASLRPHMRGGEPCVPDRLEDRTPISCEWAEKEHTGWRAEPKVEFHAPGIAFSRRGCRRSAVALANFCVRSGVSRSLPLSLSKHLLVISAVSNAELKCPSEFRDSQAVARICVHVFHRTDPPHPILSNRARLETTDVPSFPAKGDSCSAAKVLSTAWNRCARGLLPLRSSTGPPTTRAPF